MERITSNHILLIQNLEKFDDLKIYFEKFAGFDNVIGQSEKFGFY